MHLLYIKDSLNTRLIFCYGHFYKLLRTKVKKIGEEKKTEYLFLFSLSLLINSSTLREFEENLSLIYFVFSTQQETKVFHSCYSRLIRFYSCIIHSI